MLLNDIDIRTDNINVAIKQFRAYVIGRPHNGYLLKELGDLYRRNEKYEQARDAYLQAIETGFDSAQLYRNLAISHERLDEDEQAEIHFKRALARDPDDRLPSIISVIGGRSRGVTSQKLLS